MILYEYLCTEHGKFSASAQFGHPSPHATCPSCGELCNKIISLPTIHWKGAWSRKDRSCELGQCLPQLDRMGK